MVCGLHKCHACTAEESIKFHLEMMKNKIEEEEKKKKRKG
jgi:hypothetical protein